MFIQKMRITLPEGIFKSTVYKYQEIDKRHIKQMIITWDHLSNLLKKLGARRINIPEGISEPLFCLINRNNVVRIKGSIQGANSSFDCYDTNTHNRIQIKACSIIPDLSSFGPNSQFDQLIFMDLSTIAQNGFFKVFDIPATIIYNHKINSNQTFKDQQLQGKRPRFSIHNEIILSKNIIPILFGNITKW